MRTLGLYNSSDVLLAHLDNIVDAEIYRRINGEFTLKLKAYEKELKSEFFEVDNYIVVEGNHFDIKYLEQMHDLTNKVEYIINCEHVFYRLNTEDNEYSSYALTGTPTEILTDVLGGTGFSVGDVDFVDPQIFVINESITKAGVLIQLANNLDGQLKFSENGFTISLVEACNTHHRVELGKNLKGVKRIIDKRGDTLKTSYSINTLLLRESTEYISKNLQDLEVVNAGDSIKLIDSVISLDVELVVVGLKYNPIKGINLELELSNTIDLITDKVYEMEQQSVIKEAVYNGIKIGPNEGFVAERTDGKAKTVVNATDGISIYADTGSGLEKNFYVDVDGRIQAKDIDIAGSGTFGGTISAATISGSTITGGSISIGAGNNIFKVDTTGNMWLGHSNYASAPFKVSASGAITATGVNLSGNITISGGSGLANLTDAGNLATKDNITMNYVTDAGALATKSLIGSIDCNTTIISGGKIITGLLTASNIQAGTLDASVVNVTNLNASNINTGTLSANRISTVGLSAEKIYQNGSSNNYAVMGGSYSDMILYYNNSEYFRIYNSLGGAVSFKVGGTTYPLGLRTDAVEVKKDLEVKDNTASGDYIHYVFPNSDGRYGVQKNNSGSWEWDGPYLDPPNYLISMVKANSYKFYTKFNVTEDRVEHYAANSSTSGNYIETTGADTTAKNAWDFDSSLRYNGAHVCRNYYSNTDVHAFNWANYGGTYGCLEIWVGGSYKGYIKINDQ